MIKIKSYYFNLCRLAIITTFENNNMKNIITSSIRRDESDYYKNLFIKCKNYLRKTWNNIRNLISDCKNICVIKSIFFNNIEHCDIDSIYFIYNNYFSDVANNM